jgi:hypothetical protein
MIPATQPVTIPERSYDGWGLLSFELTTRAGEVVDVAAVVRRCNAAGWSERAEDTIYLREPDIVTPLVAAALQGQPESLEAFQAAKASLLVAIEKLMDLRGIR